MGELHLEIIVDRLLREFKVEANVGAPQVAYKEIHSQNLWISTANMQNSLVVVDSTVTVKLNSSRWMPNGEETFKFESTVVGGAIPKEYIPAVGEGIEEAMKAGILGGFPVLSVYMQMYTMVLTMKSIPVKWHSTSLVLMAFKDAMKKG